MKSLALQLNRIFLILVILVAGFSLEARKKVDKYAKIIEKARTKKGNTIACSPYAKVPGTLSLEAAAKKMRPGMILQMHPGYYNPMELVIFEDDNITIEGVGPGHVNVPIILYGRNCIVRNIRSRYIEGESLTAVDCIAHHFIITSGKKRGKTILANCAMNYITFYPNAQDILVRNCTILIAYKVKQAGKVVQTMTYSTHRINVYSIIHFGQMVKKGDLTFENCILYTGENLFARGNKLLYLTLDNNIIYCERSLVSVGLDKSNVAKLSNLGSYYTFKQKGNIEAKPIFKKPPRLKASHDLARDNFILLPKSPGYGKGIGVNMGPKGIPVPPEPVGKK